MYKVIEVYLALDVVHFNAMHFFIFHKMVLTTVQSVNIYVHICVNSR